jgi:hypothetical protein
MDIYLPDNIFTRILFSEFKEDEFIKTSYFPSALLSKKITETKNSIGLIPTLDLLNHKDFFVSKSIGISFDESIGNSYLYFLHKKSKVDEIVLSGDVSSNEGILARILFKETYGVDVQMSFEKTNGGSAHKNMVVVGDRNFIDGNLNSAISFAEEIIELVSAPYVNFILASESEDFLREFILKISEKLSAFIPGESTELLNNLYNSSTKNYLKENLQHIIYKFDGQDIVGIKNLLQLPYYFGLIQDMIEIKFV